MRAVVLRSVLVVSAGGLVLAGLLYVASTVDARPPEVLDVRLTQPLDDTPDRALITTSMEVAFSEPVEMEDAAAAIAFEPPVDGSVSWSGSTMIFTPADPLELDTEYTLEIAPGIRDLSGNEMTEAPPPYLFATAGRPMLVETSPDDDEEEVAVDSVITLVFSALMDTASVEAELDLRPAFQHELRWSGEVLEIVPTQPLEAGRRYRVTLGTAATDIAGVPIAEPASIGFHTIAPGLVVSSVVPAAGVDGVAPTTPIFVILDRPIDPSSVSGELLEIDPQVAGFFDVTSLPDEPGTDRVLRFTPSGPLPPNTTFELALLPGLQNEAGGGLAEPFSWTFTTGAPQSTLSNGIMFLSDRSGVANVWAMNPDGTGQHQVTAELTPILDYAVAPDGSSLVIGDGRRLVYLRADGSDRQVLTDDAFLEFDPAYAPDGSRLAFARADAATDAGLGLWTWEIGGGEATPIELPGEIGGGGAGPTAADDREPQWLRAPRYSPDGQALAFVDLAGYLGVLELPAERLTLAPFAVETPPMWTPTSRAVLTNGRQSEAATSPSPYRAPVTPLVAGDDAEAGRMFRSGTRVEPMAFGEGAQVEAIAADGRILYIDAAGALRLAPTTDARGTVPPGLDGVEISEARFGPGEESAVIVLGSRDPASPGGAVERLDVDAGTRAPLTETGWRARWIP